MQTISEPIPASVLANQFLDLIAASGLRRYEATAALKAAQSLLEVFPVPIEICIDAAKAQLWDETGFAPAWSEVLKRVTELQTQGL